MDDGYSVYVIACGKQRPVKIGYASDVKKRLQSIQIRTGANGV